MIQVQTRFTSGNALLPPILEGHKGPWYASLACSHLNMALRCIKNGTRSPICDLKGLMEDSILSDAVVNGHSWWILPESISVDMQTDISLWKNQDQSEYQSIHEVEVLQTLRIAAEGFLKLGKEQILVGGHHRSCTAKESCEDR